MKGPGRHQPARNAETALAALIAATRGKKRREFFEWILQRVSLSDYADLQQRYISELETAKYMIKYLDLAYYLNRNFTKANRLRLHKRKPIDILDIGCGAGHFLLVVEYLGHRGVGLDIPDFPLVNDMAGLFGVDMRHHRMQAMTALPDDLGRFDLIVANSVGWHRKRPGVLFSRDEWDFLFKDLIEHHLQPGGRILLNMNRKLHDEGLDLEDRPLFGLVEYYGGTIEDQTIRIPS